MVFWWFTVPSNFTHDLTQSVIMQHFNFCSYGIPPIIKPLIIAQNCFFFFGTENINSIRSDKMFSLSHKHQSLVLKKLSMSIIHLHTFTLDSKLALNLLSINYYMIFNVTNINTILLLKWQNVYSNTKWESKVMKNSLFGLANSVHPHHVILIWG